ncbi:MAG TPA: glycosyltransferase, partial [Ignavibacteriaceae bacterium]|nr:glycosyltransferase [Ignavibacteriaceae bacterium]
MNNISVLMPLKNYHPLFLEQSIESLFKQTSPDWNLLIIVEKNDFKKFSILLKKELKDPRVEIIVNKGRKLSGAFNTGMKMALSEFVAILLSDDMWAPEAVETLQRYISENPGIDFFHSSRIIIDENNNTITKVYKSKKSFTISDFILGSPVKHLLCWRKEKALSFGGLDETLNSVGPDDYDFPWTMAENGASFKAIDECLYYYRSHIKSYRLTTHLPLSFHKKEIEKILLKHGVKNEVIQERISSGKKTYLRQCMYNNKLESFFKRLLGLQSNLNIDNIYKD